MPESGPVKALLSYGYLHRDGARLRTTARWQAAMARAALRLQSSNAPFSGLRLPVAAALAESHGELSDEELAVLVEAMVPIEEEELASAWGSALSR